MSSKKKSSAFENILKQAIGLREAGLFDECKELLIKILCNNDLTYNKTIIALEYARAEKYCRNISSAKVFYKYVIDFDSDDKNINQDKEAAILELAMIYSDEGNYEYAKELLTSLFDTDNRPYAIHQYGQILFYEGKYDEAISYFEKLIGTENEELGRKSIKYCEEKKALKTKKKVKS